MTQPTHPAAIPALIGAGVGAAAGILGEAARASGTSNGRIFTYKTAAAAAVAGTFYQNPPAAAGATTGFVIGERVGTIAAKATIALGKAFYKATVTAPYNFTCNQITRGRSYAHDRWEGTKEGVQLGWFYTKLIGRSLAADALNGMINCCKRPFVRNAAPPAPAAAVVDEPAHVLGDAAAVDEEPAAPHTPVQSDSESEDEKGGEPVHLRQGIHLGARGRGRGAVLRGRGSLRGRGAHNEPAAPEAAVRGRGGRGRVRGAQVDQ